MNPKTRARLLTWLQYIIYVIGATAMLIGTAYNLNGDGVEYLDIARHFFHGQFLQAANALFSPGMPLVAALFMFLPIHGVVAFKIAQVLFGLITLIISSAVLRKYVRNDIVHCLAQIVIGALFIRWTLQGLEDHIATVTFILLYIYFVTQPKFITSKWCGLTIGILWFVGFFFRTYLFYFFGGHLLMLFLFELYMNKSKDVRKTIVKNGAIACLIFVVLLVPWMGVLHAKYHTWMISVNGTLNFNKNSYYVNGSPRPVIFASDQLAAPAPGDESVITDVYPTQMPAAWSPFESRHALYYQLTKTTKNFGQIETILNGMSIFLLGGVFVAMVYYFATRKWYEDRNKLILFSAFLLYPFGYLLLDTLDQYIWIMPILALYMTLNVIDELFHNKPRVLLIVSILILISYFPLIPLRQLVGYNYYVQWTKYADGMDIAAHFPTKDARSASLGDQATAFIVLDYAGIPNYWHLNNMVSSTTILTEMCKYNINYVTIDNHPDDPTVQVQYDYLKRYWKEYPFKYETWLSLLYNPKMPCPATTTPARTK